MPGEAWAVIGLAIGALSQYLIARSTNAATITAQTRQDDRAQVERMLAAKDAEIARKEAEIVREQARADRYLTQLLEDERTMHQAADTLNKQTGGAT